MARKAKPQALSTVVHNYGADELNCRFPNHHWRRISKSRMNWDGRRATVLQFTCRCNNLRTWVIAADGEILESKITYRNPNYLLKNQGRVDRSVWRAEYVRRAWEEP